MQEFEFCGAELAAVYVLAEGGGELRLAEAVGAVGSYWLPTAFAVSGRSLAGDAVRAGRPLWLGPEEHAAYGTRGVRAGSETVPDEGRDRAGERAVRVSMGALPLRGGARVLGCLIVVGEAAEGFDADRRQLLELFADQVAAGLEAAARATLTTDLRSRSGPALIPRQGGSFVLELKTGELDADVQLLKLLGVDAADFDKQVETLLACAVPDDVPALMSVVEPAQLPTTVQQLAFRIRRPNGELLWLGLRCRVLLDAEGRPERILGVVADASYLRPSADEVSIVQQLSATLGGATTIQDVSRSVVAALRAPLNASRVAVAELEADRLVVTLLDPPDPDDWPDVWRSEWRSEWPDASRHALPTLQSALREGHVSLWPPGATLEPGLAGIGPGGLAVLPLPAEGRMVGVCLVGWDHEHQFGPEERSLLTATAGLVGQALMRARGLDARHELARTLQRSLLPRKLPALPGGVAVARYLPATVGLEVGGDWYDVIPLSDSHVALVIGDVQGHSAAAATIMGQMRTAVRAYAVEGHPPDVVIGHANRLLVGMEADMFATCCYVDLDMEEGIAWFVRAGHLPPLLRQPDGSTEELVIEGGPPLGVSADADFPITEVGLTPGSLLVLLTDGLVESANLHLETGMRRVCGTLATVDPTDVGRVADELLGSGVRRDDDVALLLLRYDGMRVRPMRTSWTVWRLPDAVSHARRFTARTLRSWNVKEEAEVVRVVVSELVTNALVHTQGEVRLDLTLSADRLRVAVTDASPRTPVKPTSVDWESTGGRGLLIVEAMSASWGSVPVSGGKQVWGEIALTPEERVGGTETA